MSFSSLLVCQKEFVSQLIPSSAQSSTNLAIYKKNTTIVDKREAESSSLNTKKKKKKKKKSIIWYPWLDNTVVCWFSVWHLRRKK